MIHVEMRRAFKSRGMLAALAVGIAIALAQFFSVVLPYATSAGFEAWRSGTFNTYPPSVFSSWIGAIPDMFSMISCFMLPLVACLPFAATFFTDCQSGYVSNILCRTSMKRYLGAKVLAVAASSGIVVVVPLVLNFVLTTTVLPLLTPEAATSLFFVPANALGADLFYTVPLAYVGGYVILAFVTGALSGLSALALTFAMPNRVMTLIAPFLCSVILCFATSQNINFAAYNPIYVSCPIQNYPLTAGGLSVMLAVWIILIAGGIIISSKHTKSLVR